MKPKVAWPSGPPCTWISTGRLPAKRAGGMFAMPEIVRPSKLVQRTMRCSPNEAASTPGGMNGFVHRCSAPVEGSSTATWPAALLSSR